MAGDDDREMFHNETESTQLYGRSRSWTRTATQVAGVAEDIVVAYRTPCAMDQRPFDLDRSTFSTSVGHRPSLALVHGEAATRFLSRMSLLRS